MNTITPIELHAWLNDAARPAPVLLDVREPWEFETAHIAGATLIPMNTIPAQIDTLDRQAQTVVICHHGGRSMQVANYLQQHGFSQVYNLTGGVNAWALKVDPTMPTY